MHDLLILAAPGVPALLGVLAGFAPLRGFVVPLAPWAALPAFAVALSHAAAPSSGVPVAWEGLMTGGRFALDPLAGALLLLTAFLWLVVGIFAGAYHGRDPARARFFAFFCLTASGNLAAVLAADLVTFYLGFAVMTFAAYGLVVHRRDDAALRAGRVYIVLALVGEALLLTGLLTLGAAAGGPPPFGDGVLEAWGRVGDRAGWVGLFFVMGFGVKAGLVPLHVWLPLAHPVAPTPASALLSGVMLKVGALGWMRVLPPEMMSSGLGAALVVAGVVTAFYGVLVGVAQDDPKTVLAYSSVSQMGYVAIGLGVAWMSPEWALAALAVVVAFALHHGIAKASLFMSVGVYHAVTASGGARTEIGHGNRPSRRMFVVAGASASALVLAGAPLTSGAMVKAGLKGRLSDLGGMGYAVLDPVLWLGTVATTLILARFLVTLSGAVHDHEGDGKVGPGRGELMGLVLPWFLVTAAALSAPLWLPYAYPLPRDVHIDMAGVGALEAVIPVLVGAGLAAAVAWWSRRGSGAPSFRIPSGDLVVLAELVLRRVGALDPRPFEGAADGVRSTLTRLALGLTRGVDAAVGRDLSLMRGVVLGGCMMTLLAVLAYVWMFP